MEDPIWRSFFRFMRDRYRPDAWVPRWEGDVELAKKEVAASIMDLVANEEGEPLYYTTKLGSLLYALGMPAGDLKVWMRVCAEKYLDAEAWTFAADFALAGQQFDLMERIPKERFCLENKMKCPRWVLERVLWAEDLPWQPEEKSYAIEVFGGIDKEHVLAPAYWQDYLPGLLEEFRVPHLLEDYSMHDPFFFETGPSGCMAMVDRYIYPCGDLAKTEPGYIFPFWED